MREAVHHTEPAIEELYRHYQSYDLVVDSRQVSRPSQTLFIALTGERTDGHHFIPELYAQGVRHFVVRTPPAQQLNAEASFTVVDDPLHTLQALAAFHRRQFPALPVLAITGSNGKTIVKDWLSQLLAATFRVCASPRSYNSQIGVALSVWQLTAAHEIGIFEAGISEAGEMDQLRMIIQPTCGLLTNIGTAHLQNFAGPARHLGEKLSLFAEVEWLILPTDEVNALARTRELYSSVDVCPIDAESTVQQVLPSSATLDGVYRKNAGLVIAAARALGLPEIEITSGVPLLRPLTGRLEQREGRDGGPVINDSYSNDFSALAAALQFAETQNPYDRLTLILGTVQPLPGLEHRLETLLNGRVDRLVLVGAAHAKLAERMPDAILYGSLDELLRELPTCDFSQQTVLVKGASYERFDRIADALSRQLHRTQLRIDLSALRHNLRLYRSLLPAQCKLLVMAKASAYGSGALPVAQVLQDAGVDYLAVAYPEEGHALRRGGIQLPILVLNAAAYSLAGMVADRLEPVIHNLPQFEQASRLGLRMHLELDTGMGRLGFTPKQLVDLVPRLQSPLVASLFTHLAASEDDRHDAFTLQQLAAFDEAYRAYLAGSDPQTSGKVQRHVLNSNGIGRFPQATYEMVRLGIGLYGIGDAGQARQLQPALELTATISSISERDGGMSIGYGRRGHIPAAGARIAVLSIGYADGLPRASGEGRFAAWIRGHLAPTVGTICMDMCMVDVSGVPDARVGEEVTIFSAAHPVELLADAVGTIPYEILTGIGSRVHRIYVGE
ncbi:Alanine racemase [Neolewinella maritima]|uniref:Alanine racemase n=1 Tax=Neolewinella maritima TaxID=1383882 RepID=A0ABM9AZ04_9BACT|nr:alanine racemase [Neolewinella maritima]CAH0999907.1 Alanine racemase [Neolewinella maritima]